MKQNLELRKRSLNVQPATNKHLKRLNPTQSHNNSRCIIHQTAIFPQPPPSNNLAHSISRCLEWVTGGSLSQLWCRTCPIYWTMLAASCKVYLRSWTKVEDLIVLPLKPKSSSWRRSHRLMSAQFANQNKSEEKAIAFDVGTPSTKSAWLLG